MEIGGISMFIGLHIIFVIVKTVYVDVILIIAVMYVIVKEFVHVIDK